MHHHVGVVHGHGSPRLRAPRSGDPRDLRVAVRVVMVGGGFVLVRVGARQDENFRVTAPHAARGGGRGGEAGAEQQTGGPRHHTPGRGGRSRRDGALRLTTGRRFRLRLRLHLLQEVLRHGIQERGVGLAQFRAPSGTPGAPVRPQEEGGLRGGGGPRPGRAESQVGVRQGPQSDVRIDAGLFSEGQDFGSGQNWTEGERVGAGARHGLRSPARLRGRSGADRWDRDDQVSFFIRGVILLGDGRKSLLRSVDCTAVRFSVLHKEKSFGKF